MTLLKGDDYRRQGRADAAILIVLSRQFPLIDAEEWCDVLDIDQRDIAAALQRMRERHMPPVRRRLTSVPKPVTTKPEGFERMSFSSRGGWFDCPDCGKRTQVGTKWVAHRAEHHPEAS